MQKVTGVESRDMKRPNGGRLFGGTGYCLKEGALRRRGGGGHVLVACVKSTKDKSENVGESIERVVAVETHSESPGSAWGLNG